LREAGGVRYALTYDVAEHEARIDNLVQLTVSGAVAIGLVTLLTIYFVAGRLTGDLTEIAHRVESAETDERPLFHPHMTREVAVVAQALDRARGRQADVLAREREFTANLSHELRTPLSVIRSDAEMLAELPDMPECVRKRAASIIARSDEIAELTKGLLELARETRPGRPEPVELAEVIEAIWARVGGAASALSLGIDRRVCLSVDPRLLDIVISNVLANALRHGARACACDFSAATLSLADDGPGVGEAALPRIFSRHMRGGSSKGFGLGLALVAQVCAACGWEVEAANGRAGGLVVRITFTPSQILHGPLTLS
jgi:signal transduction histidine kinase